MIKNFWKEIEVVCGNHKGDHSTKMYLKQGPSSLFYACPKYYPENRQAGELCCVNRVNLIDFEKIVDRLSEIIEKAEENGQQIYLTNIRFKIRNTEVIILNHTKEKIVISVLNTKALS